MNMKNCADIMKRYSLARIPFIAFNSMERARALEVFRSVSQDLSLPFYVHTMSKGMSELSGSGKTVNEDKSIMGALDFIAEQMRNRQNLTFILTEVSDIENDSMTSRYFLDIVTMAEECGGVQGCRSFVVFDLQIGIGVNQCLGNRRFSEGGSRNQRG